MPSKTKKAAVAQALVITAPGDWRVLQALRGVAKAQGLALELRDDTHFFSTVREFAQHRHVNHSICPARSQAG